MVKLNYFTSIVLTMVLFLGVAEVSAHDFEIDGIYYNFNDDGTTISVTSPGEGIEEYSGAVIIPSSVVYSEKTYSVVAIDAWAFSWCKNLTSVVIPNSVISIGDSAFEGCVGLTAVEIPNSVTTIGFDAFGWCDHLKTVSIGNSVTSIGDCAFEWCGLTTIEIPNSVTSIGAYAFWNCWQLAEMTIGSSVSSIGEEAFACGDNLEKIIVNSSNTVYDSRENCNAIIETNSNTLICGCNATFIPSSINIIGDRAFDGCGGLKAIEIPNSVTNIGYEAFRGCRGLKTVIIGNSVTSIDDMAFDYCRSLETVIIGNSVTSIGQGAFKECVSLSSVVIPNSVTSIGFVAFAECSSLESIIVGSGNHVYDSRENCNAIIETATNRLCVGCKNTNIPITVTSIGDYAFSGCSGLSDVNISNSVESIGNGAFQNCDGLSNVEIPNSVTTIGSTAFFGCNGMRAASIGYSVTSIGFDAFYGCSSLISFTSHNATPPIVESIWVFSEVPEDCVLYVPDKCKDAYKVAEGWSRFTDIRELPAGVKGVAADDVKVRGENGVILIEGAEDARVEVYNAAGMCIFSGMATEVPMTQRGIYVVKVANHTLKLAI